jgi:hypothetical protein
MQAPPLWSINSDDDEAAVVPEQLRMWRLISGDEGQPHKTPWRCGAYRDSTPAARGTSLGGF